MATLKKVEKTHEEIITLDAVTKWFDDWKDKKDSEGNPYPPLKHGFTYGIAMNEDEIMTHIKAFNKALASNEGYQAYDKDRIEMATECARKDAQGKPIMIGNKFDFVNPLEFSKRLVELQQSDEHKEAVNEFQEFLQEKVTLEIYAVKFDDVPDVPLDIMRVLKVFIAPPE